MLPNTVNTVWVNLLSELMHTGSDEKPREMLTQELLGFQTKIDMNQPVVSIYERKMGYRFMCAEAWWILSAKNDVDSITPYSKHIKNFSDDGILFHGAYGPKLMDQLTYVVDALADDKPTRQAVANIWRENPRKSKDIPCTLSIQWLIRDGKLHCFDTMRSSDAWLGWVYDVFNFSCASMWIVLALRERGIEVELGDLTLTAASQHLYEYNFERANTVVCNPNEFDVNPVDLSQFGDTCEFVQYLKDIADYGKDDDLITPHWLRELPHVVEQDFDIAGVDFAEAVCTTVSTLVYKCAHCQHQGSHQAGVDVVNCDNCHKEI